MLTQKTESDEKTAGVGRGQDRVDRDLSTSLCGMLEVLTMVMGEYHHVQPLQHLSQLIVTAAVLPSAMGHKDEGPGG